MTGCASHRWHGRTPRELEGREDLGGSPVADSGNRDQVGGSGIGNDVEGTELREEGLGRMVGTEHGAEETRHGPGAAVFTTMDLGRHALGKIRFKHGFSMTGTLHAPSSQNLAEREGLLV